jgi:hypothetical protein
VERKAWSYELPPAGAPDVGVEQYQVAGPGAESWKATALLERDDELYVAAAPSGFALRRHLVAIPWSAVERVDHDELTIHVRGLDDAVELDPSRAVENEPADARRVTELPPELMSPQPTGDVAGPRDRLHLFGALGAGALGFLTLMGAVVAIAEASTPWRFALLVVPAVLLVLALALSIAAWKRPYAPSLGSRRGSGRRPL